MPSRASARGSPPPAASPSCGPYRRASSTRQGSPRCWRGRSSSATGRATSSGSRRSTRACGFCPRAGTSVRRLCAGQVAALYDPRTKTLALVASALVPDGGVGLRLYELLTGRDLVGELLVAHELTHALEDQHWGIPTTPEPLGDSHGDRLLARRALLEGDATLASFAYVARSPLDAGTIARIADELHGVRAELEARYPDVPEVVRAALAFEYDQGTSFAGWALAAGGWPAVDRAEADPPESTEQVLHPARYFGLRDHPVTIALGGTERLEAQGWTRVYE